MESTKLDTQKNINMDGDQPSFTMADVSSESKTEDVAKDKRLLSYQISPIASRSDRFASPLSKELRLPRVNNDASQRGRRDTHKTDSDSAANRALLQAALSSGRWPPHVVVVWALALLLTHVLHAAAALLANALPPTKKLCTSLRRWTEESWLQRETSRMYPLLLGFLTVTSFLLYSAMFALYRLTLWSIEPLYADLDAATAADDVTVTDYDDLDLKLADKS